MCLNKVVAQYEESDNVSGVGWKVYVKLGEGEYLPLYKCTGETVPAGEWVEDKKDGNILARHHPRIGQVVFDHYRTGFHLYAEECHARALASYRRDVDAGFGGPSHYVVVKVKYRKATTRGLEYGTPVVVAREIKIVEEEDY
jgi:hypothetical protein